VDEGDWGKESGGSQYYGAEAQGGQGAYYQNGSYDASGGAVLPFTPGGSTGGGHGGRGEYKEEEYGGKGGYGGGQEMHAEEQKYQEEYEYKSDGHQEYKDQGVDDATVEDIFSLTRHNKLVEVEELLERGVPVNVRDRYGNSILSIACQNGLKKMAKLALRRGADINARNVRALACMMSPPGSSAEGDVVFSHTISLSIIPLQYKGNTPLHFCFTYGYGDTLGAYLTSKGADTTIRNHFGAFSSSTCTHRRTVLMCHVQERLVTKA
jgi:hypothetical protein